MMQNDTSLRPIPQEPGKWQSIALALLVHSLLFAILWYGIRWQNYAPANMEAEVWEEQTLGAEKPSATKAEETEHIAETKGMPAAAEVALEQEKEKPLEPKKDAPSPSIPDTQANKAKDLEHQSAQESRNTPANLAPSNTEDMSPEARQSYEDWRKLMTERVKAKIQFNVPSGFDTFTPVEFDVTLRLDGSIAVEPQKTQSSAVPGFDDTVRQAIKDSAPFPPDSLGRYHSLTLQFKPNDFKP